MDYNIILRSGKPISFWGFSRNSFFASSISLLFSPPHKKNPLPSPPWIWLGYWLDVIDWIPNLPFELPSIVPHMLLGWELSTIRRNSLFYSPINYFYCAVLHIYIQICYGSTQLCLHSRILFAPNSSFRCFCWRALSSSCSIRIFSSR